jgi:Fanconi anemia group M protein
MGFPPPVKHKGMFIKLGERLRNIQSGVKYPALIKYYALLNVLHMLELLETQGIYALRTYMEKVDGKESKSAKMLMHTPEIVEVKRLIYSRDDEHPKLKKLIELVKSLNGKKMIVFAQYRDQIKKIENELKAADIRAKQFVGKKDGVTRKQQEETIAAFRNDEFDVLVASCIGEEGLDIPKVDAVIFYEPIPSEIRSIQRRGRAARLKEGEVHILMTRGTRDEYYYWSSINKEKKMKQILYSMQAAIGRERAKKSGTAADKPAKATQKRPKSLKGQTKIDHFF